MTSLKQDIEQRVCSAVKIIAAEAFPADFDPVITLAANPTFGDFQANFAMKYAKLFGGNPRVFAQTVADALAKDTMFASVEVAGPGFINMTLTTSALINGLQRMQEKPELAVQFEKNETCVVDYSSPNTAKEMHVGHLRSTVIGDVLARVFEKTGHRVIRQNHVGDWGTQFGMLICHLEELSDEQVSVTEMTVLYQQAKQRFDHEIGFAEKARQRVVDLQAGDVEAHAHWQRLCQMSEAHFMEVYRALGVSLTSKDVRGESSYNHLLPSIVADLQAKGLCHEDQGAQVTYPKGFINADGEADGMIVQKRDGGYLYATTDLAAARYRVQELHADRVIYVTDARQSRHFAMVFQMLAQAGWQGDTVFEHVPFGMVLGADKRPFKTRDGGTVKLLDLIQEAISRALVLVKEKNPNMPAEQHQTIARAIGIGCLKYADLSGDRVKDYVFDFDRMISFEGNTAAYIQNAYVRIASIFRKAEQEMKAFEGALLLDSSAERALALKILQWPEVVVSVAQSLEPHRLCTWLYELATAYHKFYDKCPVLKSDVDLADRASRLLLSKLTALAIEEGLNVLGIAVVEKM